MDPFQAFGCKPEKIDFKNLREGSLLDRMENMLTNKETGKIFRDIACTVHYGADIGMNHLQLTSIPDIFTKDSNPGRK